MQLRVFSDASQVRSTALRHAWRWNTGHERATSMCLFSCVLPSVSPPAIGLEISSCFPRPQMVYHSVPSLRALQVDISGAHDEAKPHESVKSKLEIIRYHHYPVLYCVYVFSASYAVKSHNFMLPVKSICGALSRSPLVSLI